MRDLNALLDQILNRSTADQTEAVLTAQESYLTRFANNEIHQSVHENNLTLNLRVVIGQQVATLSTNQLDDASLDATLKKAVALARLQPADSEFRNLPVPRGEIRQIGYDDAIASCTPQQRADLAGIILHQARSENLIASGSLATEMQTLAIANSQGVRAIHTGSLAHVTTVVMGEDSSGYANRRVPTLAQLDVEAVGSEAVTTCLKSRHPKSVPAGTYPVILQDYAAADLLHFLGWLGFSALAYQEGRSFLTRHLGEQLFDTQLSIADDPTQVIPTPFDFEGVPKSRVSLVEAGIARELLFDTYTAQRAKRHSTGHALLAPNPDGPTHGNLVIGAGDRSLDDLIKGIDRGLFATRFHYTNVVEPMSATLTGMTRDGLFWVEDGEIAYPVKNMRFTQGLLDAFRHIRGIGHDRRLVENALCPAIALDHFSFTSQTQF